MFVNSVNKTQQNYTFLNSRVDFLQGEAKYFPTEKQHHVVKETITKYALFAEYLGLHEMKSELEDLAFRLLFPELYEQCARIVKPKQDKIFSCLPQIVDDLRTQLKEIGINAIFEARRKNIFSAIEKTNRRNIPIDDVRDLVGMRIIVDSKADCYRVLGEVHNQMRPIPGEFDDYIAAPKINGYQSLHTNVECKNGGILEVQIRTHKMHAFADSGQAAHWQYKNHNYIMNWIFN